MNLIFFGDSITQGLWDERGGFASRIKQDIYREHLDEAKPGKDYNIVYLRGSSSDTSKDLKNRIAEELQNSMSNSPHYWTVVLSIGMNDCGMINGENKIPKEKYQKNLEQIIDKSLRLTDQVIAVGLNPINEQKINEEESLGNYLNSQVKDYEDIFKRICSEKDVKFIPTFEKLHKRKDWNKMLFDGLHPNSKGHKKIYQIVNEPIKAELNFQHHK